MKVSKGFTLIELMIVSAIIGVLLIVAVPGYRTYIERAYSSEILAQAYSYKTVVEEFAAVNRALPRSDQIDFEYFVDKYGFSGWIRPSNIYSNNGDVFSTIFVASLAKSDRIEHIFFQAQLLPEGQVEWNCRYTATKGGDLVSSLYAPVGCMVL